MILADRIYDLHLALGVACFEVDGLPGVSQVGDAEVTTIQLSDDLVVEIVVTLTPVNDDRIHGVAPEDRENQAIIHGISVAVIECHRHEAAGSGGSGHRWGQKVDIGLHNRVPVAISQYLGDRRGALGEKGQR